MIIDTEVHLLHPEVYNEKFKCSTKEAVYKTIIRHKDYDELKEKLGLDYLKKEMRNGGIDLSFIMGMAWLDSGIQRDNNNFIKESIADNPRLFKGFWIPNLENIKKAVNEIYDLDNNLFIGVKMIPKDQGVHIDDKKLKPILEAVREKKMCLMVHTDHIFQSENADTPYHLYKMLLDNKKLKVLAPHLGGLLYMYAKLPTMKSLFENTCFITSVSASMYMVSSAIGILPERIAYGSDFPFNHCHSQIEPIKELQKMNISEENIDKIMSKNILEFIGGI